MTWGTPARRKTQAQSLKSVSIPAPIGGTNTVDPGLAMPATDCVYAYNLIAAEFGFRSRLGFKEWCTGLTGATDSTVRTVLPFVDAVAINDKLFACTSTGIWDCTNSSNAPTQPIVFDNQSGQAGYGISTVMVNPLLGHLLLYSDEVNGLFIWANGWALIGNGVNAQWLPDTAVALGVQILNGGNVYVVSTAGVTGPSSAGPPTGTGTGITDGTAAWDYVGPATPQSIGPSLADQNNGTTFDTSQVAFVTVWKSRLFLIQKNSAQGWYLDVNAVYGEATSFNFGAKMRAGGPLVGLYNWSYDGGSGIDTHLVGVSSAGDVVIYSGTDPTSATTFGLTGCWSVGGVPAGRRIVTDYGGDLLVESTLGVVPLSKLIVGQPVVNGDRSLYATGKISNLFNQLVANFGELTGWAIHIHPVDNALLLLVPQGDGLATTQLAMSFATKGWTQYRNMPMCSAAVWAGQLYFGTQDGRVCLNTGYVDNVTLGSAQSVDNGDMTRVGSTVTVLSVAHGFDTGPATLECTDPNYPSGTYVITVTDANHFTYASVGTTAFSLATGLWTQPPTFTPVAWSLLTAYSNMGNAQQKQLKMCRLNLVSDGPGPLVQPTAKYGLDFSEPPPPPTTSGPGVEGTWDYSTWDVSVWGGELTPYSALFGLSGMGREVALAVRGTAIARTILVNMDVFFEVGGML